MREINALPTINSSHVSDETRGLFIGGEQLRYRRRLRSQDEWIVQLNICRSTLNLKDILRARINRSHASQNIRK